MKRQHEALPCSSPTEEQDTGQAPALVFVTQVVHISVHVALAQVPSYSHLGEAWHSGTRFLT